MPARSKRPSPPARMVELLAVEKKRLLAERGFVTAQDFERSWERCWAIMVTERAWPHATTHRRAWRSAMLDCKPETRASFLDEPSGFSRYIGALAEAMDQSRFAGNDTLVGTLVA